MTSLDDQQALLLYRVGPVLCCSPSYSVLSIIQPVKLTHPPGSDTVRPGIFRHSGHVVKTEELRVRFGVDEADRRPGRMIIAEIDSGRTAFWVDDIIDVISMPGKGWGQLSPQLPKGIFNKTLLLDDKIYLYAEFDALHKLQGHGLLKAYIEQLQVEKQQHEAPVKNQTISTATVTTKSTESTESTESTNKPLSSVINEASLERKTNTTDASLNADSEIKTKATKHTDNIVSNQETTTPPETTQATKLQSTIASTSQSISKPESILSKKELTTSNRAATLQSSRTAAPKNSPIKKSVTANEQPAITNLNTSNSLPESASPNSSVKTNIVAADSHVPWLKVFIVVLLLISSGTGIYYYFYAEPNKTTNKHNNVDNVQTYPTSTPEPVVAAITPVIETQSPADEKVPVANTVVPVETNIPVTPDVTPASNYQASIEKDDEGITIVIKAPKEELVLKSDSIIETPSSPNDASSTESFSEESSSAQSPEATIIEKLPAASEEKKSKAITKPRREEIIHIVIKGDTLWHIARRYVKNPFRYPELARLSNIKNPDRIYPGNRVRIIREFN